jgi:hypothetical protein
MVFIFTPVGNAVLSVPSENSSSMGEFSAFFVILRCKIVPLRGRNAEDSVPYRTLLNNLFTTKCIRGRK